MTKSGRLEKELEQLKSTLSVDAISELKSQLEDLSKRVDALEKSSKKPDLKAPPKVVNKKLTEDITLKTKDGDIVAE